MKVALISAIYRKSLTVDLTVGKVQDLELNTGTITNLMSSDAMRMQWFMYGFHQLWIAPVTVVAGLILLYSQVQWACFVGLGILALSGPSNGIVFAKLHKIYNAKMKIKVTHSFR